MKCVFRKCFENTAMRGTNANESISIVLVYILPQDKNRERKICHSNEIEKFDDQFMSLAILFCIRTKSII